MPVYSVRLENDTVEAMRAVARAESHKRNMPLSWVNLLAEMCHERIGGKAAKAKAGNDDEVIEEEDGPSDLAKSIAGYLGKAE